MKFEPSDDRIRYVHLELERDLPTHFEEKPLPEGYHYVNYAPGDRDAWIRIEIGAKEIKDYTEGIEVWNRYYGTHEAELPGRMFFVETSDGDKVATATAMYDTFNTDDGKLGWLHWVAVRNDHQGKGLSRPLIAHTLNRLIELGYSRAHIPTQTSTWLAVRLYLDFGFLPYNISEAKEGWEIARALTDHPTLRNFAAAPLNRILREP
ncbi:MAG: GNAT family N-acetyltransferase [Lachnospiraceae bacterium]|nr:GNAT family N-acetyltransferase [Lachnospiraceae bacterium]